MVRFYCTLLLAFSFAVVNAQGYWHKQVLAGPVQDVYFVNTQVGYLATHNGILKSVNSGYTWNRITNTGTWAATYDSTDFFRIHFINSNIGFATGSIDRATIDTRYIFKTADAGATWQVVYQSTLSATNGLENIKDFQFLNTQVGFAVHSEGVLKTTDGGQTWSEYKKARYIHCLYFWNEQTGIISNTDTLYRTRDGGATWEANSHQFSNTEAIAVNMANDTLFYSKYNNIYFTTDTFTTIHSLNVTTIGNRINQLFLNPDKGYIISSIGLEVTTEGNVFERFDSLNGTDRMFLVNDTLIFAVNNTAVNNVTNFYRSVAGGGRRIPNPVFISPEVGCVGQPTVFTNLSESINTFQWNVDSVNVATTRDLSHTFSTVGPHTVRLTATQNGLSETFSKTITITQPIDTSATLTVLNIAICFNDYVNFRIAMPNGYHRYGIMVDGKVLMTRMANPSMPVTYTGSVPMDSSAYVVLVALNGCDTVALDSAYTIVLPAPDLSQTFSLADSTLCLGDTIKIIMPNTVAGYNYKPVLYNLNGSWNADTFGVYASGGTLIMPVPATKAGRIRVMLTDPMTACTAMLPGWIVFSMDTAVAKFTSTPRNPDINEPITLTNHSIGANLTSVWTVTPPIAQLQTIGPNAIARTSVPGIYTPTLTVTGSSGCSSQLTGTPFQVYDRDAFEQQNPEWALEIDALDTIVAYRTATDNLGNIYVAYARIDSSEPNTLPIHANTGLIDSTTTRETLYLLQYDANGAFQWQMKVSPHVFASTTSFTYHDDYDIAAFEDGVYFTFRYKGDRDVTYAHGTVDTFTTTFHLGINKMYKVKSTGEVVWSKLVDAHQIISNSGGKFLISSGSTSKMYDSSGALLYTLPYGYVSTGSFHIDINGNVYFMKASGSYPQSTGITITDGLQVSHDIPYLVTDPLRGHILGSQSTLFKLKPNGGLDWFLSFRGTNGPGGVITDREGNIFVTGADSSVTIKNGTLFLDTILHPVGATIIKLDSIGNKIWSNAYNNRSGFDNLSWAVDSIGNLSLYLRARPPAGNLNVDTLFISSVGGPDLKHVIAGRFTGLNSNIGFRYSPVGALLGFQVDTLSGVKTYEPNLINGYNGSSIYSARMQGIGGNYEFNNQWFTGSKEALLLAKTSTTSILPTGAAFNLSDYEYCSGDVFTVPFTLGDSVTVTTGNTYTLSLISSNGLVGNTVVATLASTARSGQFTATIPAQLPSDTYRWLLTTSTPPQTIPVAGIIVVHNAGSFGQTQNLSVCYGDTVLLSAPGTLHQWSPFYLVTNPNDASTLIYISNSQQVTSTYTTACGVFTNTYNLNAIPFPDLSAVRDTTFRCVDDVSFTFGLVDVPGYSYEWDRWPLQFDNDTIANPVISANYDDDPMQSQLTVEYSSTCPAIVLPFTVTVTRTQYNYDFDTLFVSPNGVALDLSNLDITNVVWWDGQTGPRLVFNFARPAVITASYSALDPIGCYYVDTFIIIADAVGIDMIVMDDSEHMTLYPNPYHDKFTIEIPQAINNSLNWHVKVLNIQGQEVLDTYFIATNGMVEIELPGLAEGVYVVTVQVDNILYRKRLIKL